MKKYILLLLIFCLLATHMLAQQMPGKMDSLNSEILSEKRYLQIVLPTGYDSTSKKKYDVTYVLDGDWNTKLLTDISQVLSGDGRIAENIIVGILNKDRDRDFLPTHNKSNPTSGGADHFLLFFKNELIPYINRKYPSDGENTIFGHSFGGVFVTYALFTEPRVFKSYIAADPAYWWDKAAMLKTVPEKLSSLADSNITLYIAGREGRGMTEMHIQQMDSIFKKNAPAWLAWKVTAYDDESHGTVRLKSAFDGLKFSYLGFGKGGIRFIPMNGILLKNQPITLWYAGNPINIKYTSDGTEPTRFSPPFKETNILDSPAKITIRRILPRSSNKEIFSGNFIAGDYLPSGKLQLHMKSGGFNYSYYEGKWNKLPNFKNLKPLETGRTDSIFNIDRMPRKNNFAIVISGQLEITEDGYYLFALVSDGCSRLYLNNHVIIDCDSLYKGSGDVRSYILPLKKGFYNFREEYFQMKGGGKLDLEYLTPATMPSGSSMPIPWNLQYGLSK